MCTDAERVTDFNYPHFWDTLQFFTPCFIISRISRGAILFYLFWMQIIAIDIKMRFLEGIELLWDEFRSFSSYQVLCVANIVYIWLNSKRHGVGVN